MNGFASHLEHKAGDRIEVDWSGPTMRYTDMESGRSVTVYLFVSDLVCDNLRTSVTKHPKDGEIILTREYEALAEHYGTGILPADVRAPRQKSSVENSVRNVALKIIARLRDVRFTSFHALKKAVARELELLNDAPFECGTWLTGRRCGPN